MDWQDFDGDSEGELGYKRYKNIDHQISANNNLYGASVLEGKKFNEKYLFEWNLNLSNDRMFLLEAIYSEQQYRFKNQQDGRIKLLDQRLAFLGRNPRDRAKIGSLINSPSPPSGFSFFWAKFNVLLSLEADFSRFFMMPSGGMLHKVKFQAVELDIVSVSEDE